ncbi:putative AC9 transposase, partial [Bienertia sinuspersici]
IQWWKNHSSKFPVLARTAKDILVIPATTIASESTFSVGRRVLDEKRFVFVSKALKCVYVRRIGIKPRREHRDLEKKRKMKMTHG